MSDTTAEYVEPFDPWDFSPTMEVETSKYTYPIQLTTPYERESWTVSTDHCYARPWTWRPESAFLKPPKVLFIHTGAPDADKNEEIIVDEESELKIGNIELDKVRLLMEECEKHAKLARNSEIIENWEENIVKTNWTLDQYTLFDGIVSILNNLQLGKLTYTDREKEPIFRRAVIDKAVSRVRALFSSICFEIKLIQWLHQLLLDHLDQSNLGSYLDILQTLKTKLPSLVEKILNTPSSANRMGLLNNENLLSVLRKKWDPVESQLNQDKPKKLPANPIIILVPGAPRMTKRVQRWMGLLSNLGQVVSVPASFGTSSYRMTMTYCIDQMFAITKGKIQEMKESYPGRHIVLVGIGAGATLALQVAHVEPVFCVVSLGFSLMTAEGRRGEPDDNLLELQCPVLFVIGQLSSTSFEEDMADLRERMRIETALVIVGSADNNLVVNDQKKREEGITQSIVDRSILDEIGEFISNLIHSPFPPQVRQSPTNTPICTDAKKLERKRYSSNASSLDSEPPSPNPRRPGNVLGRPPKAKVKLESKLPQITSSVSSSTTQSPSLSSSDLTPISSDTASADSTTGKSEDAKITRSPAPGGETGRPITSSQLSTLLQGGIKSIHPVQQKGGAPQIKVLENVQLAAPNVIGPKLLASSGAVDISKLNIGQRTTGNNVILLPDGKLKSIAPNKTVTLKGPTGKNVVFSMAGSKKTNFISKRPQPAVKPKSQGFASFPTPIKSSLPPPTNLTSEDIMDLPIIFADDEESLNLSATPEIAANSSVKQQPVPVTTSSPKIPTSNPSKFVILSKPPTPVSGLSNFLISSPAVKRPNPVPALKQAKYTKILLSKKSMEPLVTQTPPTSRASMPSLELMDLENELVANTIVRNENSGIPTVVSKRGPNFEAMHKLLTDDDDPDYVPPKNLKL